MTEKERERESEREREKREKERERERERERKRERERIDTVETLKTLTQSTKQPNSKLRENTQKTHTQTQRNE